MRTTDVTSGIAAVGIGGQRQLGEHVLAWLGAAVLDVGGERSRRATPAGSRPGCPRLPAPTSPTVPVQAEALAEPLVVLLGHAEHVGDGQHGEGLGVGADELAPAVGDELVELPVGEAAT